MFRWRITWDYPPALTCRLQSRSATSPACVQLFPERTVCRTAACWEPPTPPDWRDTQGRQVTRVGSEHWQWKRFNSSLKQAWCHKCNANTVRHPLTHTTRRYLEEKIHPERQLLKTAVTWCHFWFLLLKTSRCNRPDEVNFLHNSSQQWHVLTASRHRSTCDHTRCEAFCGQTSEVNY